MIDAEITGYENTSSVIKTSTTNSTICNAPKQDNKCKDCRLCWDTEVEDVAYILH